MAQRKTINMETTTTIYVTEYNGGHFTYRAEVWRRSVMLTPWLAPEFVTESAAKKYAERYETDADGLTLAQAIAMGVD